MSIVNAAVVRRRFIIVNVLVVTAIAAIVSFILPREYKARTTILPPSSQATFGALSSLSPGQIVDAVTNFTLPMMATPSDLYASMLKSETVLRNIVDSLDLMTVYDEESEWGAVIELRERLRIEVEPSGIITVEAIARDPDMAARIGNLLTFELNRLNLWIESRKGGYHVDFLATRLTETEAELFAAQQELREFQERHMAISLERQSAALIESLAGQKAKLTAAEIELALLEESYAADHPSVIAHRALVRQLAAKLQETESGARTRSDSVLSALDIRLNEIPELSLRMSVLIRNVRIQELIYEILAQQLEMARIQERRDTPVISVLDVALPPEEPFRPRKLLIILAAFVLSLAASVLLAVTHERLRENPEACDAVSGKLKAVLSEIRKRPLG